MEVSQVEVDDDVFEPDVMLQVLVVLECADDIGVSANRVNTQLVRVLQLVLRFQTAAVIMLAASGLGISLSSLMITSSTSCLFSATFTTSATCS